MRDQSRLVAREIQNKIKSNVTLLISHKTILSPSTLGALDPNSGMILIMYDDSKTLPYAIS